MVQKVKTNTLSLEKILGIAGLGLVVLGCIANGYYASVNHNYINDLLSQIAYFNYLMLLGGGFIVGSLLAKKGRRLYNGAVYALLAMTLSMAFDVVRVICQNLFGYPPFPWGKIIFSGVPLVALIVTILVAVVLRIRTKSNDLPIAMKMTFIIAFIGTELFYLITALHDMAILPQNIGSSMNPVALVIGSYLINPLLIAFIGYLAFRGVKRRFDRLFYAVFVGVFAQLLTLVLWDFRTNPSLDATNLFAGRTIIVTIILVIAIVWTSHRSLRSVK